MIPSPKELKELARAKEGSLRDVPFAVLLLALESQGRTAVLEIRRNQLHKKILLEEGTPVDCRSNLLHETLGKFLVHKGKLSEENYQKILAESASSGALFGDVLMRLELLTAFDFFRLMQQNLAHKLLDGFTWREGTFHITAEVPHVESPLKVRVAQLVFTGITRFAPTAVVDESVAPLIGRPLGLHPSPDVPLESLKLSARHAKVITLLKNKPRMDELAADSKLPYEELTRLLYALALLGTVGPAEALPAAPVASETRQFVPLPASDPALEVLAPPAAQAPVGAPAAADVERVRNDIMRAFLAHRRQDAFDLLGAPLDASPAVIRQAYLEFSQRYAPWACTGALANMAEKAQDLFVAGARAYALLMDAEARNSLAWRKQNTRTEPLKDPSHYFAIKTDLLDAETQFKEGVRRLSQGKTSEALKLLEFAADCDPQNGTYQAELAWCRLWDRQTPDEARRSLALLQETMRMDPECGVAVFYAGEACRILGDRAQSEPLLRRAIKMMPGDRRPTEALKALLTAPAR